MSAKASSSQSSAVLGGSGSLSHVYIQHPPLRFSVPESSGLFYDDGNKLLISVTSNQVFSWKTVPYDPNVTPSSDSLSEGPILSIRISLDGKVIAIQRSNSEIHFLNRETRQIIIRTCKPESESILGFFWTDCPLCNFVIIKTSGLDLFAYNFTTRSIQLVETKKLAVTWYSYTHESRLLLLASGMQCKTITGFQLSSAGFIRLPRFEMTMAKSDANSKPVLDSEDVHIITVYGRIYCLQVDRIAMLLNLYRFYRDAVIQQGSLPIYSSKIAINVVDNVLLVHQLDSKVVILYDIFVDSRGPISAPLPLLLKGFPKSTSASRFITKDEEFFEASSSINAEVYGDGWTFLVPDLICDIGNKFLWKLHLDLEAISASSSEVASVLEFLQRRKLEASKAKQLCLETVRTIILERRPVPMVARALAVLVTSFSLSLKTGTYPKETKTDQTSTQALIEKSSSVISKSSTWFDSDSEDFFETPRAILGDQMETENLIDSELPLQSNPSGPSDDPLNATVSDQQETHLSSPAISPDELYKLIFVPLEDEMVGEPSYLVAIIVELLRSANLERIKVHASLYVFTIQLLARSRRYTELGFFIMNKIIEPSKEVALQLLESGRQNIQARKLALDMLRQFSLHDEYVAALVQDGYYIEALRYTRKHKVTTVRPSLFLESAFASNDSHHLAAVLRFFSDFMPGFNDTTDHQTYFRILNEMNSSIPV